MSYVVDWHPQALTARLEAAFRPAALGVQEVARKIAPKGVTGDLASRVLIAVAGKSAILSDTSDHANPVVRGSRPHPIDVEPGTGMPTPYGVFLHVDHPGNAPNPFLNRAAAKLGALYVRFARL